MSCINCVLSSWLSVGGEADGERAEESGSEGLDEPKELNIDDMLRRLPWCSCRSRDVEKSCMLAMCSQVSLQPRVSYPKA
jgi:hypothetical protein